MPIHPQTRVKLERLAREDREAQQAAQKARDKFFACLVEVRPQSTVRELAEIVGLSPQRIHELTTVRNRRTAHARSRTS